MTEEIIMNGFDRIDRRRLLVGLAASAAVLPSGVAHAAYPDRFITLIVPFAPGGASDLVARMLSAALPPVIGQSVVVENRGGGGGNIGITAAARSTPDGYTLLVTSSALVLNPGLYARVAYDPVKDFVPIVDLGSSPNVLVALPGAGFKTLADLVERAKAEPGKLNYSTAGVGTTPHLAVELLKIRAGIDVTHIPYPGAGPAFQAVLSGTVQVGSVALSVAMQHIKAGTVVAFAQTGATRWPELPDVPTVEQAGYANSVTETVQALLAPAGTPKEVLERIEKDVVNVLKQRDIADKLKETGFGVIAGGPDVLRARIARELPMWKDVIQQAGLKPL
jgi:tripartite-type tricarboxylate transporter receptor subunit TctC